MNKIFGCLVASVFMLVSSFVFAGPTKIGVVDLQKIMQNSQQMKEIQDKLEHTFRARRDKLVATETSIKQDMEKLKRDSAVLSQTQRKELENKIMAAQQQFERDGQQYQQELNVANNDAMEGFFNKIKAAIAKVAADEKYDLVLQKDAAPFSMETLDITTKVMKEII